MNYDIKNIFDYTENDMDIFLSNIGDGKKYTLNEKRYMVVFYLTFNNLLKENEYIKNKKFQEYLLNSSSWDEFEKKYTWRNVLDSWKKGDYLKKPNSNQKGFYWQTLYINSDASSIYKDIFIDSNFRENPDNESFREYMKDDDKSVGFVFWNKAHDTKLVIPNYKYNSEKNFSHLKNFMENADIDHQKEFWKLVALAIEEELQKMKPNDKLYVSTHGHGVAYLHVRIEHNKPKYFDPEKLDLNKMSYY